MSQSENRPGLVARIANLDRLFAWGVVGAILSVVGLWLTVFYQRAPRLEFAVLSDADVVQVRQAIGDLHVVYGDRDILKEGLRLRMYLIRLSNTGRADILQTHYDNRLSFGFEIPEVRIVAVQVTSASSEYLRSALDPRVSGENRVDLSKVIFEQDKGAVIQVLAICPAAAEPKIVPIGKIAGIERVDVKRIVPEERASLWARAFAGDFATQAVRAPLDGRRCGDNWLRCGQEKAGGCFQFPFFVYA